MQLQPKVSPAERTRPSGEGRVGVVPHPALASVGDRSGVDQIASMIALSVALGRIAAETLASSGW